MQSAETHVPDEPELAWLLCEAPGLLGERSGHGALVAALESGTPGNGSASSASAEALIERARPHAARARRLGAAWRELTAEQRALLRAHYTPRNHWPAGVLVSLGRLAAACLHVTENRQELEKACTNALAPRNVEVIRKARTRAWRAVNQAHRAWRGRLAAAVLTWAGG